MKNMESQTNVFLFVCFFFCVCVCVWISRSQTIHPGFSKSGLLNSLMIVNYLVFELIYCHNQSTNLCILVFLRNTHMGLLNTLIKKLREIRTFLRFLTEKLEFLSVSNFVLLWEHCIMNVLLSKKVRRAYFTIVFQELLNPNSN
jgi:hypothetical protein